MKYQLFPSRLAMTMAVLCWMAAATAQGVITAPKSSQKTTTSAAQKKTSTAKKTTTTQKKTSTTQKKSSSSTQRKTSTSKAATQQKTSSRSGSYTTVIDSAAYMPSYSSSATTASSRQLQELLTRPVGQLSVDLRSDSYATCESAMKRSWSLNSNSKAGQYAIVYFDENASISNVSYCGLPFRYFRIDKNSSGGCQVIYTFEIKRSAMTRGLYDYLDLVVADFRALGIPLSYERKNEKYDKAYGSTSYGGRQYIVEITDYDVCVQYQIRVRQ